MSTPRTKRPFAGASADPTQRQITSFFSTSSEARSPSPPSPPSRQPLLPSSVQANLLSVGMRVRKSVPEGYKTAGPSAFKLWTDASLPGAAATTAAGSRATSRELLPFCGIHRVGGLDTQPEFRIGDEDEDEDVPDLDAVPELTLSQESVESTASEPSRKRLFADDDDATDDTPAAWTPQPSKSWDPEVSPRSLEPASWGNTRAMAVPRSRVRKSVSFKDLGQENMAIDGDFEEAEFLVWGESRDMDTSG